MNNAVSQRFKNGAITPNIMPIPAKQEIEEPKPQIDNSNVVPTEVLRQKLYEILNPLPLMVENPQPISIPNPVRLELVQFANLYEFAHWYENNKTLFSEAQQKPLDTLVEARNITTAGCNCDRNKRKILAENYFKDFWVKNAKSDLLPTLQKNLNTKKLLIGNFISFPE